MAKQKSEINEQYLQNKINIIDNSIKEGNEDINDLEIENQSLQARIDKIEIDKIEQININKKNNKKSSKQNIHKGPAAALFTNTNTDTNNAKKQTKVTIDNNHKVLDNKGLEDKYAIDVNTSQKTKKQTKENVKSELEKVKKDNEREISSIKDRIESQTTKKEKYDKLNALYSKNPKENAAVTKVINKYMRINGNNIKFKYGKFSMFEQDNKKLAKIIKKATAAKKRVQRKEKAISIMKSSINKVKSSARKSVRKINSYQRDADKALTKIITSMKYGKHFKTTRKASQKESNGDKYKEIIQIPVQMDCQTKTTQSQIINRVAPTAPPKHIMQQTREKIAARNKMNGIRNR